MRTRLVLLRRALRPSPSSPTSATLRTFTANTSARSRQPVRPQLPFLSATARTQFRYLTTERKAWLRYEIAQGFKYTVYFWIFGACVFAGTFAINQEIIERRHPTPREWTFRTRLALHGAHDLEEQADAGGVVDWVRIMGHLHFAISRLEDPTVDGTVKDSAGRIQQVRDAPQGLPTGTKMVRDMPEPWRRGYFEALLMYAKASEHVDGWVMDKSRDIVFPPEMVVGPSNPMPQPVPPGAASAPKEEDCEVAFPGPDEIYLKILATSGFTPRQRMDAALAYANWLEFKGFVGPADVVYEDAVMVAREAEKERRGGAASCELDEKKWTLDETKGLPSANLLQALTAHATFKARHGHVETALPTLISLLRARRNLPKTATSSRSRGLERHVQSTETTLEKIKHAVMSVIQEPPFPPPPDDGTSPPVRDTQELCEEAALQLHIGEILYTSQSGAKLGVTATKEEGIAWTREAVDIAEEQLHRLSQGTSSSASPADVHAAHTTCRECLGAGLDNWARMVARLVRDEAARKESAAQQGKSTSWLSLWGQGDGKDEGTSRWAAEEKVIGERQRRAREVLEELPPPQKDGIMSLFRA